MKCFLLIFLIFFTLSSYAQDSLKSQKNTRTFVPLGHSKLKGKILTKEDSLNFKIWGNDTLVLIQEGLRKTQEDKNRIRVEYEPKDSTFLAIYKQVVFGTESQGSDASETMKLWKEDVKVLFDSTVPPAHRNELMRFASEISSGIDSLNIYETHSRKEANYFIFYKGSEEEFDHEPRITGNHGGYYINWNKKQQINRAVLKLNTFFVNTQLHQVKILKYYFLKSLGRFYTSSVLPCESYFSRCAANRVFTPMDQEILAYHYSYGNPKGVDLKAFEELHQNMKEQLEIQPTAKLYIVHIEEEKE